MLRKEKILVALKNGIIALDIRNILKKYSYETDIIYLFDENKKGEKFFNNYSLIIHDEEISGILRNLIDIDSDIKIPLLSLLTKEENYSFGDASIILPFEEKELTEIIQNLLKKKLND